MGSTSSRLEPSCMANNQHGFRPYYEGTANTGGDSCGVAISGYRHSSAARAIDAAFRATSQGQEDRPDSREPGEVAEIRETAEVPGGVGEARQIARQPVTSEVWKCP